MSYITSSVVVQTGCQTEFLELSGVGLAKDFISCESGVDDLADDFRSAGASDSNNQSVFWGVIFVIILDNQSLSGVVVSFTLYRRKEILGMINFILNR